MRGENVVFSLLYLGDTLTLSNIHPQSHTSREREKEENPKWPCLYYKTTINGGAASRAGHSGQGWWQILGSETGKLAAVFGFMSNIFQKEGVEVIG